MGQSRQEIDSATKAPSDLELLRIGVAVLLGLLCVALFVLDVTDPEGSSAGAENSAGEAVVFTEYELLARAETIEPQPFWVGRRPNTGTFELERDPNGNLALRYLPTGTTEGDDSQSLTVATYQVADARQSLERAALADGETLERHDSFVALAPKDDFSAYVVFEDQPELQVEVFSPKRGEAARLIGAGVLTPLHWTPLT